MKPRRELKANLPMCNPPRSTFPSKDEHESCTPRCLIKRAVDCDWLARAFTLRVSHGDPNKLSGLHPLQVRPRAQVCDSAILDLVILRLPHAAWLGALREDALHETTTSDADKDCHIMIALHCACVCAYSNAITAAHTRPQTRGVSTFV